MSSPLARTGRYAARLNAGGPAPQPLGPLTQVLVQQGDTVTVTAPGYYPQPVSNNRFTFSLASFVAGLLQPPPGAPRADGRRGGLPLLSLGISAALPGLVQAGGGVPKGYVRLLVFDADSNLVGSQTQQLSQAARTGYEALQVQVIAPQDGYVTAYVGNESPADVFFDDVRVEHRQGLQVQETHYDPTGLELAGLGGTSPGLKTLSQYKWNGKEFQPDLGLNWNHQDWRFFDAQLGRWHVTDPEIENGQESWTPYSFGFDNAVRYADADGRCPGGKCPPDPLKGNGNAASQPDLITAIQIPLNNIITSVVSTINNGLAAMDRFSNSLKGSGSEQAFGVVLESKSPNGTSAGGNTARRVHKMDGDKFKEMKDVIDGPALLGMKDLGGNRSGRSVADVTGATADAVDAKKDGAADVKGNEQVGRSGSPDTLKRIPGGILGQSHYVIKQGGAITDAYDSGPLKRKK